MKEKGSLRVINPKGTQWCSKEVAAQIAEWIEPESQGELANMLPETPGAILAQMKKEFTILAAQEERIVGHVTLWQYATSGWGEVGSLIIAPHLRGQGIGKALVRTISLAFPNPFRMVATVKTEPAKRVFLGNGFEVVSFDTLRAISESAWRECCPCFSPPELCPLRDKKCLLLVRR